MNVLAGLAAAAVIFAMVFIGSALVGLKNGGNLASRLQKYNEVKATPIAERGTHKRRRERSKATDVLVQTVDRIIENQSFAERLRGALSRADIRFTVGEYLILWVTVIVLGIFIGQVVFRTVVHTVVFGVAGTVAPFWFLRYRAGQRLKRFNNMLADTIVMMANSLRSGYSMLQSMELVSKEMSPPIADEFHRVITEVGLGLSPEQALANLMRRIKSVDLEIMVMAINVQREVGGNLSTILDTIAHTIRERVRIKGEIKTLTAQAQLSGYVISFMPIGLGFVIYTLEPKQMSFFWTNMSCGLPMLIATLFLMTVGFFIMRKITQIEV
ncbi:MAG TPA: type II secretion system F family protein [Chloroflexota bacterium]|nr:type II secretion system F family protein [Chloroflexota bacterium]